LKALKQMTSRKLKGDRARFWQQRYFDSNVHGEKARSQVIRYIHRNPVKRGLVAKPEQYPWSSFNHHASGLRGVVEIESDWTGLDGETAWPTHRDKAAMNGAQHSVISCSTRQERKPMAGRPASDSRPSKARTGHPQVGQKVR
jgi:hypothetical protein